MLDLILENPIAQGLWIIAMSITVMWFTQKSDEKVFKIIMLAKVFWISHFLILWLYSAVVAGVIWLIRIFLSLKYKKNKLIFVIVLAVTIASWVVSYLDDPSLVPTIPLIASCISVYGFFFLEKIKLRLFMMVVSIFWFTFSFHMSSLWWMLNEIVVQTILIITMYKMIHDEGKKVFFIDKFIRIIKHKTIIPDVWRFIVIYDFINKLRKSFKEFLLKEIKLLKIKK